MSLLEHLKEEINDWRYLSRLLGRRMAFSNKTEQYWHAVICNTICRFMGHDWRRKMYGQICISCGLYEGN